MSDPTALVTFLLDKSGSMEQIKQPTIEAFNAYLTGLKKDGEGIRFSLVQFDTLSIVTTWKNAEVASVTGLTNETYQPQGGTPLVDAAYKTIKAVERKVAEYVTPPKVVICIQTDGEENASREYSWDALNVLIKEKIALGWQFNFMGVGLDSYHQAGRMGIHVANTVAYNQHDGQATMDAFTSEAANTMSYARGMSASTGRSMEQKMAAGDKFDPALTSAGEKILDAARQARQMAKAAPLAPVKGHVDDIEL